MSERVRRSYRTTDRGLAGRQRRVARACDRSLGQTGAEALPQLIGLMADEDVVIREAATSAVVRIGPVRRRSD